MSYNGKKVIRILGHVKSGVRVMVLQYANRAVEVVRLVDKKSLNC